MAGEIPLSADLRVGTQEVLVVIDVQNYFINDHTRDLPDKIAAFIEETSPDFLIFTKFVNHPGSNFSRQLNWHACSSPPETDIHPSLKRFTTNGNVFEKASYSIFKSPDIVSFLNENSIAKLLLCGIDIDACVLASAFDAFDLGYDVRVLEELSRSTSGEELDAAALKIIARNIQK